MRSIRLLAPLCAAMCLVHGPMVAAHITGPAHVAESASQRQSGTVHDLVVRDAAAGLDDRYTVLRDASGQRFFLYGKGVDGLRAGTVEVTGVADGSTMNVESIRPTGKIGATGDAMHASGTLAMLHADNLEDGRSEYLYGVRDADDHITTFRLPALPRGLAIGMKVAASGMRTGASTMELESIEVHAPAVPPKAVRAFEKATVTNKVLVIMVRFTDSPASNPFTQAQMQASMSGGPGTGSVAEYYKEVSYGQQLLNTTVTPWLTYGGPTPANCDINLIANAANSVASSYGPAGYDNLVYVFPNNPTCGWLGLAYVGWGRAYINASTALSVIGHELGHNFGLLHAGSVRCGTYVIGNVACSASEYGDPFDIMGNQRAMHFNTMQKDLLGWIPASSVSTHTVGTRSFTVGPVELGGQSAYAVQVPAAPSRTYWLEYRQPLGFDAGLSSFPNAGLQTRVATPFETSCSGCGNDTEFLDQTPSTPAFTDGVLQSGRSFEDATFGVKVNVMSVSPTAATFMVQSSWHAASGDFDGNGTADLLLRSESTGALQVWLMNGPTIIGSATLSIDPNWIVTNIGDLDGDGRSDLVLRHGITGQIAVAIMNGSAVASFTTISSDPNWSVVAMGDFNADGRSDLVVRHNTNGQTVQWLMNGSSILLSTVLTYDGNWSVVLLGDFNGDGRSDIILRNASSGVTLMWLMSGASVTASVAIVTDPKWRVTHAADLNGDHRDDLVLRHDTSGQTMMWLMNGTSTIFSMLVLTDAKWRVTHLADFNGDGRSDVLLRHATTGQTLMWLMNGTAVTFASIETNDPNWSPLRVADFNGDGRADILMRQSTTGQLILWRMNGPAVLSSTVMSTDPTLRPQP
jgi:hypothetical protein